MPAPLKGSLWRVLMEKILENARRLRKEMTKEERHLWYDLLLNYPVKIYKQKIIGNYIVDFYCHQAKLVIELDGSQHYEEEGQAYDAKRTAFLEEKGLSVFRVSNRDIKENFSGVCEASDHLINGSP